MNQQSPDNLKPLSEQELKQELSKKMYSNSYAYLARPFRTVVDKAYEVLSQHTQRARVEGEDSAIEKAHQPCECGKDHFGTPVRSVQGNITTYCQFSRVQLAQLSTKDSTNKEDV